MNEALIRDFFDGTLPPAQLDRAWSGAFAVEQRSDGTVVRRLRSVELEASYRVTPAHIVALIEAVQTGTVSLPAVDAICFALEASDTFEWDTDTPEGERVARGLFLLGSPEVNYPLSGPVLGKISRYLVTGEDTFTDEDLRGKRGPVRVENRWEPKRGA